MRRQALGGKGGEEVDWTGGGVEEPYFFALDFAPLLHSASSTAAFFAFSVEAFWAAASAFW